MPVEASIDKRLRRRTPLVLRANIKLVSERWETTFQASTRNVSNAGAYLLCEPRADFQQIPAPGDRLHMTLKVPPDQGRQWALELKCEAEVVRVDPAAPGQRDWGFAVRIHQFRIPKVVKIPEAVPSGRVYVASPSRWVN